MRDLLGVSGGFNRSWEGLEQVGIVSRSHYNALSVQYLGIRQTMWQHGGRCSGVSVKILSPQICYNLFQVWRNYICVLALPDLPWIFNPASKCDFSYLSG